MPIRIMYKTMSRYIIELMYVWSSQGDNILLLVLSVCVYSDEKSELGMEELTAEADTLRAIHDKVCLQIRETGSHVGHRL